MAFSESVWECLNCIRMKSVFLTVSRCDGPGGILFEQRRGRGPCLDWVKWECECYGLLPSQTPARPFFSQNLSPFSGQLDEAIVKPQSLRWRPSMNSTFKQNKKWKLIVCNSWAKNPFPHIPLFVVISALKTLVWLVILKPQELFNWLEPM